MPSRLARRGGIRYAALTFLFDYDIRTRFINYFNAPTAGRPPVAQRSASHLCDSAPRSRRSATRPRRHNMRRCREDAITRRRQRHRRMTPRGPTTASLAFHTPHGARFRARDTPARRAPPCLQMRLRLSAFKAVPTAHRRRKAAQAASTAYDAEARHVVAYRSRAKR